MTVAVISLNTSPNICICTEWWASRNRRGLPLCLYAGAWSVSAGPAMLYQQSTARFSCGVHRIWYAPDNEPSRHRGFLVGLSPGNP